MIFHKKIHSNFVYCFRKQNFMVLEGTSCNFHSNFFLFYLFKNLKFKRLQK